MIIKLRKECNMETTNKSHRNNIFWIFAIVVVVASASIKIARIKSGEDTRIQYQQIYQKLNTIENKIDTLRFD